MKKSLLALLLLDAFCLGAHAQSSVTLYGIVDAGLGYNSGQATAQSTGAVGKPVVYSNAAAYSVTSGTWSGSRWGLKGTEDLGGGMSTVFQVENGFSITSGALGQGSREFGRQAWMGLSDKQYGTVTFGRQYDPIVDFVGSIGPTSFLTGMAAHPGDLDNIDNQSRENNSIKYASPVFSGFQFGALYGVGGQPGSLKNQSTWSIGGQYNNGPFAFGAAYLKANNASSTWNSTYDGTFSSSINAGFASSQSQQIIAASTTYKISAVTLGLSYSNLQYQPGAFSFFKAKEIFNSAGVTAMYQVNDAWRAGVGYDYTRGSSIQGSSGPQYNQFNFSTFYSLSKRTALYGLVGYQKASGKTLDAFGNVINATASIGDVANGISSASNTQTLVRVGVRHTF